MKQTRMTSLLKSIVSTAVGFAVAYVANMLILPLFGLPLSHSANFWLTCIYTAISLARGYVLERVFERFGWRVKMSPFAAAVLAERQRQIDVEGWSIEHDDAHVPSELALAGASYLSSAAAWSIGDNPDEPPVTWTWGWLWWKPTGFRRDLIKGCALGIAEGEKFDRSRTSKRSNVVPRPSLAHNKTPREQGGASA